MFRTQKEANSMRLEKYSELRKQETEWMPVQPIKLIEQWDEATLQRLPHSGSFAVISATHSRAKSALGLPRGLTASWMLKSVAGQNGRAMNRGDRPKGTPSEQSEFRHRGEVRVGIVQRSGSCESVKR